MHYRHGRGGIENQKSKELGGLFGWECGPATKHRSGIEKPWTHQGGWRGKGFRRHAKLGPLHIHRWFGADRQWRSKPNPPGRWRGDGRPPLQTALPDGDAITLAQGSTTLSQGPTGSGPGTASVYKMRLRADPHRSQITSIVHRSPRQARRKGQGASGKGGEQRSSPLTPHAASSRQPTAPVASCASLCISRPDRSSYLRGARRRTSRKIRHSCPAKRAGE